MAATVLLALSGCGGGAGGGSKPDPVPPAREPTIDVQLTNITVFQGVEIFSTDYVRNSSNYAIADSTSESSPFVSGRKVFVALQFLRTVVIEST